MFLSWTNFGPVKAVVTSTDSSHHEIEKELFTTSLKRLEKKAAHKSDIRRETRIIFGVVFHLIEVQLLCSKDGHTFHDFIFQLQHSFIVFLYYNN